MWMNWLRYGVKVLLVWELSTNIYASDLHNLHTSGLINMWKVQNQRMGIETSYGARLFIVHFSLLIKERINVQLKALHLLQSSRIQALLF